MLRYLFTAPVHGLCAAVALGLLVLSAEPAQAAPGAGPGNGNQQKNRPDREEIREKILDKFDTDGDGKLNEQERAAFQKAREERQASGGKGKPGAGKPGQGKPGAGQGKPGQGRPGKPGNRAEFRQKLLEQFDKDGDGKLNETERQAARQAFREKRMNGNGPAAGRPRPNGAGKPSAGKPSAGRRGPAGRKGRAGGRRGFRGPGNKVQ